MEPLAQDQGSANARRQPGDIGNFPSFQHSRGNQRLRVDVGQAQSPVVVRQHAHQLAGLEFGQRRLAGVDFVAEDPKMSGVQAAIFVALEAQDRQLRHITGVRHGKYFGYSKGHSNRPGASQAVNMLRNHLAEETSPYLLQHADNPVEWYPWGEAALTRAKQENKPILLSIGYSACHWCHVMAHESFEDPATATLMNELFINIKVDREERPDLDRIYQIAQQLLTHGNGGWPLTMFLSPRGQQPFFGGTYFPKQAGHGMPAFGDLLRRVAEYYRGQSAQIEAQSAQLQAALASLVPQPAPGIVLDV